MTSNDTGHPLLSAVRWGAATTAGALVAAAFSARFGQLQTDEHLWHGAALGSAVVTAALTVGRTGERRVGPALAFLALAMLASVVLAVDVLATQAG